MKFINGWASLDSVQSKLPYSGSVEPKGVRKSEKSVTYTMWNFLFQLVGFSAERSELWEAFLMITPLIIYMIYIIIHALNFIAKDCSIRVFCVQLTKSVLCYWSSYDCFFRVYRSI